MTKEQYAKGKEVAREEAIEWQLDFPNHVYYWSDIAYYGDYFYELGKKYGLLREFHENGIC